MMSKLSQNALAVLDQVSKLYFDPDVTLKEKASKWLEEFQSSFLAWDVCNELLSTIPQNENEMLVTYFAAQTLRTKIMKSLKEVPTDSMELLKNSLLGHVERLCLVSTVIATQLALAVCDLAVQMPTWKLPAVEFIQRYHGEKTALPYLLEILQLLPEEVNNDAMWLGDNRRKDLLEDMENSAPMVLDLLKHCLDGLTDERLLVKVIKCLASWFYMSVLPGNHVARQHMLDVPLNVLQNSATSSTLHEAASDCICAALYSINDVEKQVDLAVLLKEGTYSLQTAYHNAVAHEDVDKCINLCHIFTELAEALAVPLVETPGQGFGDLSTLDLLLVCVGHHQYEVAEITFNVWYRLGDMLQPNPCNQHIRQIFSPYIERLIVALVRHCQMEPDQEKLLEEHDDFYQFRKRAADFVRDVTCVIDVTSCFVRLFGLLTDDKAHDWDVKEAILFIMSAIAGDVKGSEAEIVPQLLVAIAGMAPDVHLALRHTGISLLGRLAPWIRKNPHVIDGVLTFLQKMLHVQELSMITAESVLMMCEACKQQLASKHRELIDLVHLGETLNVSAGASLCLVQGAALAIRHLDYATILADTSEICKFLTEKLSLALHSQQQEGRKSSNDPESFLDRFAAIFQAITIDRDTLQGAPHPCLDIVEPIWVVLKPTLETYKDDNKIVERWCRCLRYIVRCIGRATPRALLASIVTSITSAYATHPHSCFLYMGSVLVDEMGREPSLLVMLSSFVPPSFNLLNQERGLENNPATVDDLFRLCSRFVEQVPIEFLSHETCKSLFDCALVALHLSHRDANNSVTKFLSTLIESKPSQSPNLVDQVVTLYGESIVEKTLNAALFEIPSFLYPNIGDIWWALIQRDRAAFSAWLNSAFKNLRTEISLASATPEQCMTFHKCITTVQEEKEVGYHLRDFCRLYR